MSVGTLKRLLTLVNLLAVLGLGSTAYAFYSHRQDLKKAYQPPDFKSTQGMRAGIGAADMQFTTIPLGRYPEPASEEPKPKEEAPVQAIETVLQQLGKITNAVVVFPPYDNARPSITFLLRDGTTRTLALGEAIQNKPHPDKAYADAGVTVPDRYIFVGCEIDAKDGMAYFLFDMAGDGKTIERARWTREDVGGVELPPATAENRDLRSVLEKGAIVGTIPDGKAARPEEKPAPPPGPEKLEPVQPPVAPRPEPVVAADSLFEEDGGVFAPTAQGAQYLEKNYNSILNEVQTETYRDSRTGEARGVYVRNIKRSSAASQFGILKDDVILTVNNRPVSTREQAINVVKDEIQAKKQKVVEVRILRNGQEITKRYDTRDPATRKAAAREFGKR